MKSSKLSRISLTSSAKANAIVRKATLEAEAKKLEKKIALQQELPLQQQREALELEIELAKARPKSGRIMKLRLFRKIYNSCLHRKTKSPIQKNPQLPPPQKNEQNCADETEFKCQQESQVTRQPLNPNAKEWIHGPKLESKLTDANARDAESSVDRTELRNNDTAHMMTIQRQQNKQIERLMIEQRRHNAALLLPQPEVPIFKGDPIEYCSFIRAFENLIETKTDDSSARLYFLVQNTAGDVQELLRSCLAMDPEEGYKEARRFHNEKYGQNYKKAAAYVGRLTKGTPMRTEDGAALQNFSVLLTSCRNTLKDIGYLNKLENPDAIKTIVDRLPCGLREKWRETVDDIIQRKESDVNVEDITSFVEKRARVVTHPVYGNLGSDNRNIDSGKPKHKPATATQRLLICYTKPRVRSIGKSGFRF